MDFGVTSVVAITVICYLVVEITKLIKLDRKYAPVLCGILGGILGIIGMYTIKEFPADDILSAIAVGIVSGLAATGINQVCKQLIPANKQQKEKKHE
ncbi:MAG: phage holin family protein [Clostridiales bacterium]|nr:phage holin family protein [Clostridiales bacterium]